MKHGKAQTILWFDVWANIVLMKKRDLCRATPKLDYVTNMYNCCIGSLFDGMKREIDQTNQFRNSCPYWLIFVVHQRPGG